VTGHHRLLETNPALRRLIEMRNPYIDPINILQVGHPAQCVQGHVHCLKALIYCRDAVETGYAQQQQ
jgi:hypothetical protein